MRRVASAPSIPGIARSMMTMCGSSMRAFLTASSPDDASPPPPPPPPPPARLEQCRQAGAHDMVVLNEEHPRVGLGSGGAARILPVACPILTCCCPGFCRGDGWAPDHVPHPPHPPRTPPRAPARPPVPPHRRAVAGCTAADPRPPPGTAHRSPASVRRRLRVRAAPAPATRAARPRWTARIRASAAGPADWALKTWASTYWAARASHVEDPRGAATGWHGSIVLRGNPVERPDGMKALSFGPHHRSRAGLCRHAGDGFSLSAGELPSAKGVISPLVWKAREG